MKGEGGKEQNKKMGKIKIHLFYCKNVRGYFQILMHGRSDPKMKIQRGLVMSKGLNF